MNPPWTRTAFPFIAGVVIAWLLSTFTPLDRYLALLSPLHITQDTITLALAALIGYAWHAVAIKLGARWPWIEKLMLGSSLVPVYVAGRARKRFPLTALVDVSKLDPRNVDSAAFKLAKTPAGFVGTKRKPVGKLGNDSIGDCVVAWLLHAIIILTGTAKFTKAEAIKIYSAIGGYIPGNPSTDQGLDPVAAAKWWQKNGITDSEGVRHELIAYGVIKLLDFNALRAALNLAGDGVAVGVSLNLPYSAQDQFPTRKWSVVTGSRSQVEGGHQVLGCNDDGENTGLGTWGSEVEADRPFMNKYSSLWLVLITDAAPASLQAQAAQVVAAIKKV
jgi:hypothetical protein